MNDSKKRIAEKVRELYNEYGIRSVTMDDVVRELGISKKTLYKYFTDKSELISYALDFDSQERRKEYNRAREGASNAIEELLKYYDLQLKMIKQHNPSLAYDLKKYYPEVHNKFLERKRKAIYESVLANLVKGKAEGLYREELNEEIISKLNLMRVEAFINTGIFNNEEIMTKSFFREVFTYHMYGIVNEKGRKILEQNVDKLK